jgi:glycosyltransferase involved in cell wall biosynthesis
MWWVMRQWPKVNWPTAGFRFMASCHMTSSANYSRKWTALFGMVVVEALAAGMPVIVSDHAGSSEAIRENENGWVVLAGDQEALFQRMLACCHDIDLVRSMSATCIRSAADHDWSHYSHRSVEIFATIVEGGT